MSSSDTKGLAVSRNFQLLGLCTHCVLCLETPTSTPHQISCPPPSSREGFVKPNAGTFWGEMSDELPAQWQDGMASSCRNLPCDWVQFGVNVNQKMWVCLSLHHFPFSQCLSSAQNRESLTQGWSWTDVCGINGWTNGYTIYIPVVGMDCNFVTHALVGWTFSVSSFLWC